MKAEALYYRGEGKSLRRPSEDRRGVLRTVACRVTACVIGTQFNQLRVVTFVRTVDCGHCHTVLTVIGIALLTFAGGRCSRSL